MYEVRFHGRGGQGAVTAANILAAAAFKEGNDVQAFPIFGVERRGAPVAAFMRMDKEDIDITDGQSFLKGNPAVLYAGFLLGNTA